MARKTGFYTASLDKPKRKRKGVHSKNASKSQNKYKQPNRGQGSKR
jgi:hypothetical protein